MGMVMSFPWRWGSALKCLPKDPEEDVVGMGCAFPPVFLGYSVEPHDWLLMLKIFGYCVLEGRGTGILQGALPPPVLLP